MDLVVADGMDTRLLFSNHPPTTTKSTNFMEVLLIEKETFDTIISEHGMLCDTIIMLASHIRRKLADELLSVAEVCGFLKIAPTTLYNLRMNGKIGFVRDENNKISYPMHEVMTYLESCGVPLKQIANGG